MLSYILRRLLGIIPLLLGITLISFFVIHLAPGKPTVLGEGMDPRVSFEARERLEKLYGLDKPIYTQYLNWVKRFVFFDFGNSFIDSRRVSIKIIERMPVTITLNILSLLLILIFGIIIGVKSAINPGGIFDKFTTIFVFIGFSIPTFWLALLLMNLFGITFRWLPISGLYSLDFEYLNFWQKMIDLLKHIILPVFILSITGLAGVSRYMRSNMISVLDSPYICAARAKGLPEKQVLYKHALRNAILPIVTILGLSVPALLGGSVIFESIFAIPGIGRLFYEAVMARDYPVIMAELSIGAILTLIGNLIADISYAYVDPRIRYKK
ncbi:MAG: ABC transporter permease [Candidatus Omnitrophota bacterium]